MTGAPARIRRLLTPLASGAPVRVFAIEGANSPGRVQDLRVSDHVRLVDSPRSATVLLVAGTLPEALRDAARRIHDMMPHPRATACWVRSSATGLVHALFPSAFDIAASERPVDALRQLQRELLTGRRPSEGALLPDEDPAPWRGIGPYGQGGTGMTGGVPYGRPMAGRVPDRDGLELDQLPVRIGPFFPPFPSGLMLEVHLQGDVIQQATVAQNPFAADGADDPFHRALAGPVLIAELELARARHHLRWLAHALHVHGLEALGRRVLAFAAALEPTTAGEIAALRRLLERTRTFSWATAGVGVANSQELVGRGLGPVARAAGISEDARIADRGYTALGFVPVLHYDGDARARWRQRLAETMQSLELAVRAGMQRTANTASVEGPCGLVSEDARPTAVLLALLPALVQGMEWGDAVTTIVSLDIDLRRASAANRADNAMLPAPVPSRDDE